MALPPVSWSLPLAPKVPMAVSCSQRLPPALHPPPQGAQVTLFHPLLTPTPAKGQERELPFVQEATSKSTG